MELVPARTNRILDIKSIKRIHIIEVYNELLYGESKLAIGTLKYINNILSSMLAQAVYNNFIYMNPAESILRELCDYDNSIRTALTIEEQKSFLAYVKRSYASVASMFIIAFGTGLRIGELAALTWEDIDLENNSINVDKTLYYPKWNEGEYVVGEPKTMHAYRSVPIIESVREAICRHKENKKMHYRNNEFVFLTRNGTPYSSNTMNALIRRIVEKNNSGEGIVMKYFSSHIMRHSFATRCFEAGMDVKIIQSVLGHSRIETTMDIYVHCCKELLERDLGGLDIYMREHN